MAESTRAETLGDIPRAAAPGEDERILTPGFLVLWCIGFLYYASVYLLVPILPLYLQQRGASTVVIGALLGSMSMAALIFRPFAGWLSDAFGRRPLIALGLAGLLVFNAALPFVAGFALFGLLRIISGFGWGGLTANANTLAGELAPPGRRGEAIGYYTMAGSIAFAVGPAVGLYLIRIRGYEAAFWAAAGLTVLALVLSFFLQAQPRAPLAPLNLGNLISWPAMAPAGLVVLHAMTYGGLITFLPLLARQRSLGDPGLFFTIYAAALIVLRGAAGRLSDRLGRPAVIAPGLFCGAASMLTLALAAARWQMLVAAVLFSLAMAAVQPPTLAWALDVGGGRRGTAMATMVAAQDLGISLGGAVLGYVGTLAGYGALFGTGAGLSFVALMGLAIIARHSQAGGKGIEHSR
jgi:MFS family permease